MATVANLKDLVSDGDSGDFLRRIKQEIPIANAGAIEVARHLAGQHAGQPDGKDLLIGLLTDRAELERVLCKTCCDREVCQQRVNRLDQPVCELLRGIVYVLENDFRCTVSREIAEAIANKSGKRT